MNKWQDDILLTDPHYEKEHRRCSSGPSMPLDGTIGVTQCNEEHWTCKSMDEYKKYFLFTFSLLKID